MKIFVLRFKLQENSIFAPVSRQTFLFSTADPVVATKILDSNNVQSPAVKGGLLRHQSSVNNDFIWQLT
jgi:hypothetical protein